jgi:hypothetical protein
MHRLALFVLLVILPGPIGAQEGGGSTPPARTEATGSLLLKGGQVAGANRIFLGGSIGLVFGGRFAIGGAGLALTENVELEGSENSTGFDLGMGYGGLTLQYWHPLTQRLTGEAGLLIGAGHAQVRSLITGNEVGADNFAVMEPEIGLSLTTLPPPRSVRIHFPPAISTLFPTARCTSLASSDPEIISR